MPTAKICGNRAHLNGCIKRGQTLLILTSDGLSTAVLRERAKQEIEKSGAKTCAIIPTAMDAGKNREQSIEIVQQYFEALGVTCETFDLNTRAAKELSNFGAFVLLGGNPFKLLDVMRRTKCRDIFVAAAKTKVIIGASAGALVLGQRFDYILEFVPFLNKKLNLTNFEALCITDVNICPHVARYTLQREDFAQILAAHERQHGIKITPVEDGEAVFVYEGRAEFVTGEQPAE